MFRHLVFAPTEWNAIFTQPHFRVLFATFPFSTWDWQYRGITVRENLHLCKGDSTETEWRQPTTSSRFAAFRERRLFAYKETEPCNPFVIQTNFFSFCEWCKHVPLKYDSFCINAQQWLFYQQKEWLDCTTLTDATHNWSLPDFSHFHNFFRASEKEGLWSTALKIVFGVKTKYQVYDWGFFFPKQAGTFECWINSCTSYENIPRILGTEVAKH